MLFVTGALEEQATKRTRITKVRRAILSSLALTGILAVAMLAPNTLQLLGKVGNRTRAYQVRNAAHKLVAKGFLRYEKRGNNMFFVITPKGLRCLQLLAHDQLKIKTPLRWDKKWRIVVFDIPEPRARLRRHLSATLKRIGLFRLQDSVWVHPYDCEELIALLKTDFRLGKEVLYIIADVIENDRVLRAHFGFR